MPVQYANNWDDAPDTIFTETVSSVADIPTEMVLHIPRAAWKANVGTTTYGGTLNNNRLDSGAVSGPNQTLTIDIPGFVVDPFSSGSPSTMLAITHIATGEPAGSIRVYRNSGDNYFNFNLSVGGNTNDTLYSALAGDVPITISNVAGIIGFEYFINQATAQATYMYLQPSGTAPSNLVFIDNPGFAGQLRFYQTMNANGGGVTGTRDFFVGLLKRSAVGTPVASLVASDVVMGVLTHGSNADLIINGVSVWGRTDLPAADKYEAQFILDDVTDLSNPSDPTLLNSIAFEVHDASYVCSDAADFASITPLPAGTPFTVSFENAVFAQLTAANLTPGTGFFGGQASMYDWWDSEQFYGLTYPGTGNVVFSDDMKGAAVLSGTIAETGQQWNPSGDTGLVMDGIGTYVITGGGRSIENEYIFPEGAFNLEFTVVNSSATSSVALYTLGIGGYYSGSSIQMSGGFRLRHPGGTSPMVIDQFADGGSAAALPGSITRVASAEVKIEMDFDGTNFNLYVDGVLFYGPAVPTGTLAGKAMRLLGNTAGSGATQRPHIKDVKITTFEAPVVPPFWTNFVETMETI